MDLLNLVISFVRGDCNIDTIFDVFSRLLQFMISSLKKVLPSVLNLTCGRSFDMLESRILLQVLFILHIDILLCFLRAWKFEAFLVLTILYYIYKL